MEGSDKTKAAHYRASSDPSSRFARIIYIRAFRHRECHSSARILTVDPSQSRARALKPHLVTMTFNAYKPRAIKLAFDKAALLNE